MSRIPWRRHQLLPWSNLLGGARDALHVLSKGLCGEGPAHWHAVGSPSELHFVGSPRPRHTADETDPGTYRPAYVLPAWGWVCKQHVE